MSDDDDQNNNEYGTTFKDKERLGGREDNCYIPPDQYKSIHINPELRFKSEVSVFYDQFKKTKIMYLK